MANGLGRRRAGTLVALTILCAIPSFAATAVDTGAVAMLWHIFSAGTVVAIFQWRRIAGWLTDTAGVRSKRSAGFLFAFLYASITGPIAIGLNQSAPLPRFNDIFLIGVVLACYFFTWESASVLLAVTTIVSAWILPPTGSIRVIGFNEWYRLISFALVSAFTILVIHRMKKTRRSAEEPVPQRAMSMRAAAGD